MKEYNFKKIEKKWQRIWEKVGLYKVKDREKEKKNFYCLDMFIYPSGHGLHVGHLHGYVASDVISRYLRLKGYNVLHPMGFDAFGLPAENAAIKYGIHPRVWTKKSIKNIKRQLKSLGFSYDWSREIITCEPEYYKFTQWLFLKLYKAGLVERKKFPANFCPCCKTVLANEQVVEGKCERCGADIIQKEIEQWFFKITKYADRLLKDLEKLDWPQSTKIMQKNWIGKSTGWIVKFPILNASFKIEVFTTRLDTIFGVSYLVLSPEHPLIEKIKNQIKNKKELEKYIEKSKRKTERERISKEKTGIKLKNLFAINPVNFQKVPVFVGDWVLFHYGTGAIMGVPAHDLRDFEFAKKYKLKIKEVIKKPKDFKGEVFEGEGKLINSGKFSGFPSKIAQEKIGNFLKKRKLAKRAVFYKLRDWTISRQRYWGCPIPMIYCEKCGWQPVKEKDLPVLLPDLKDFKPRKDGKAPLYSNKKFLETKCPRCGAKAERETETMDTFVCSSWYYLRYTDPKNKKRFADSSKVKAWLPVDLYIGGREHAVGHLLYARFITKVLKDLDYLHFNEPFLRLKHQGLILGPDGYKMSKSRGNVISPEEMIEKYGADALRIYELFIGPFEENIAWSEKGIEGCYRFLKRVWRIFSTKKITEKVKDFELEKLIHKAIKKVSEDIEDFKFNTAISTLMVLSKELEKKEKISKKNLEIFLLLLSPFAPHLSEELFQKIKGKKSFKKKFSIFSQKWPSYKEKYIREKEIIFLIQINGKLRDKMKLPAGLSQKEIEKLAISREKVQKWIEDKKIKKVIFIPNKLINIVI